MKFHKYPTEIYIVRFTGLRFARPNFPHPTLWSIMAIQPISEFFLSIWLLTHFWFTVNLSHFFYPFLSNSLEIRIWNLGSIFEFAWVFHSQNHPVFILLHWSFLYIKWGVLIWFLLNPRNFNPRNFQFLVFFHSKPLFLCRTLWRHWYQKIRILLRIF